MPANEGIFSCSRSFKTAPRPSRMVPVRITARPEGRQGDGGQGQREKCNQATYHAPRLSLRRVRGLSPRQSR
jgi:hypothetical protein